MSKSSRVWLGHLIIFCHHNKIPSTFYVCRKIKIFLLLLIKSSSMCLMISLAQFWRRNKFVLMKCGAVATICDFSFSVGCQRSEFWFKINSCITVLYLYWILIKLFYLWPSSTSNANESTKQHFVQHQFYSFTTQTTETEKSSTEYKLSFLYWKLELHIYFSCCRAELFLSHFVVVERGAILINFLWITWFE